MALVVTQGSLMRTYSLKGLLTGCLWSSWDKLRSGERGNGIFYTVLGGACKKFAHSCPMLIGVAV